MPDGILFTHFPFHGGSFSHSVIQSFRKPPHIRHVRGALAFVELRVARGAVGHVHERGFNAAADGRVDPVLPVGFHIERGNAC